MKRCVSINELLILLAVGVLTLTGCSGQPGVVEGTVIRAGSGQIVTEGQIAVFELRKLKEVTGLNAYEKEDLIRTAELDENGAFSISLQQGDYVIEAWVPQVATVSYQIRVRSGQVTTARFEVKTPPE